MKRCKAEELKVKYGSDRSVTSSSTSHPQNNCADSAKHEKGSSPKCRFSALCSIFRGRMFIVSLGAVVSHCWMALSCFFGMSVYHRLLARHYWIVLNCLSFFVPDLLLRTVNSIHHCELISIPARSVRVHHCIVHATTDRPPFILLHTLAGSLSHIQRMSAWPAFFKKSTKKNL